MDRLGQWHRRLRRLHVLAWLSVTVFVAAGLQWPRIVRHQWHLDRVPLVDELLILAPVVVPLVLSWAVFYGADRAGYERRAVLAGVEAAPFASLRQYLGLHVRHHLAIVLLPVMVLLAVQDVAGLLSSRGMAEEMTVLAVVAAMVVFLLLFPVLLRRLWRARPLEKSPLRDRLEATAHCAGLELGEILIWPTGSMVANAAVTGFTRRFRYVFLTDGLLELLSEDQVVAVFGHELGHVRHRHLWLRAAAMLIPLSVGLFVFYAMPGSTRALAAGLRTAGLDWLGDLWGLPALLVMVTYVLTFFSFYSRRLEHEADLSSCRLMPPGSGVSAMCSALQRLADVAGNRRARSWQHASVVRRVEFLESVEREPKLGLRFDRRIRLFGGIVIALSLSPLICLVLCCCWLS